MISIGIRIIPNPGLFEVGTLMHICAPRRSQKIPIHMSSCASHACCVLQITKSHDYDVPWLRRTEIQRLRKRNTDRETYELKNKEI